MMLEEQISKVLEELIHIEGTLSRIKEIAEKKDKDILELSEKISDAMHRLEMSDNLSDEEAARLGREIAQTRKERRECKNFVEQVNPLLMFYAAHGNTMDALKIACESIDKGQKIEAQPIFVSRATGEAQPVSGEAQPMAWKPPRPVLCTTKGGITVHFGSVGAAARAFNYRKKQIFDCCYGVIEDVDGDKFEFITGDKTVTTKPFNQVRTKIEAELTARNAPVEPEITDVPPAPAEITDVRQPPETRWPPAAAGPCDLSGWNDHRLRLHFRIRRNRRSVG